MSSPCELSELPTDETVPHNRLAKFARPLILPSFTTSTPILARDAERELLPVAESYGVGFLPWFPLYNGLFTGKFSRTGGPTDSRIMRQRPHLLEGAPWDAIDAYERFCHDRGVGMLEATIGWLLSRPAMASVIAGATTVEQVAQNAAAASAWTPTAEDLDAIDQLFPI